MSGKIENLKRLQRLAQLKSDLEMRRFSAYREHVVAARTRIAGIEHELQTLFQSPKAFSINEARLANALAGEHSRALVRAEAELQQMLPGFEIARRAALREFGRIEALKSIRELTQEEMRQANLKRAEG